MTQGSGTRPIAGVILAGGQSSRMGQDKASLIWNGRSLLTHANNLLTRTGCQTVWVSGKPDEENGIIDSEPNAGPGRALMDALKHAHASRLQGILAIPVDMPRLTPDILRPLIDNPLSVARAWDRHPLPGFFPVALANTDRASIRSIRDLINTGPNEQPHLPGNLQSCMDNINTPEEFSQLDQN